MTTCGQLIDETQALMQSWAMDQAPSVSLSAAITDPAALTFAYDGSGIGSGLTTGVVEIDRELLYVSNVDGATATVPPWGRGYRNTTAAVHASGSRVISQPLLPRQKTLDALNQVFERIFPRVYAVKSYETVTTIPVITYDLPDDAQWVLSAKWMVPDGRQYWENIRRWRVSSGGGTEFGDTGITVDVEDTMMPGQPIQFLYAAKPTPLVNDSDNFTATGLNAGLVDVVELGAASQLSPALEMSRLSTMSVDQQQRGQGVAPGAALNASKYLDARFTERLEEERKSLQRLYPPRLTRKWS